MSTSVDEAAQVLRQATQDEIRHHSVWYIIQGSLMVIIGVVALFHPLLSSVAATIFLGWLLIIGGVVQAIGLIGVGRVPYFWLQLISAILAGVVGYLMIANPAQSVLILTLLLIVFFMVEGISKVVMSLMVRPLPSWGWMLASGIIGIVLSMVLWSSMPITAAWLLGFMLGVSLITQGLALAWLAWQARS